MNRIIFTCSLLCLLVLVQCQLPPEKSFQQTFEGEGQNCDGTSAMIDVNDEVTIASEESVVQAISSAIAASTSAILDNPSEEMVVAEASAIGRTVLEVAAQAVASVKADVFSPNPGCWGIAFGKATAVAVAEASIKGVSQGFALALDAEKFAEVEAEIFNVVSDIDVAIESVALLLSVGDGSGAKSVKKEVVANARVEVVNCAIAKAFAAVVDGVNVASVLVQVGCEPPSSPPKIPRGNFESIKADCACLDTQSGDAPAICDARGNGDYICYTKGFCPCAWESSLYQNKYWRYCGPTLSTMQKWLSFTDQANGIGEITMDKAGYGYCPFPIKPDDDKLAK